VLCANDDILTPRYFSEEYVKRIPGAQGRWIERGGHALSRTEPDLFNRTLWDFITLAEAGQWLPGHAMAPGASKI